MVRYTLRITGGKVETYCACAQWGKKWVFHNANREYDNPSHPNR